VVDACATRDQIEDCNEKIYKKADNLRVNSIEFDIDENYYLKKDAADFKDDCDLQMDEIRESLKPFAKKTEVVKVQTSLKERIDKNFEKCSMNKDCAKDKASLTK
jgi:hypothetical protein